MNETERTIALALSRWADFPLEKMTPSTRVWHDARVCGDDFLEFIEWYWSTYHVALPGDATDYAPKEPSGLGDMWGWLRAPARYQALQIEDLARLACKDPADRGRD